MSVAVGLDAMDARIAGWMDRYGRFLLRISLAVVFIWFGLLKPFGLSPAEELVKNTVYWIPPDIFIPILLTTFFSTLAGLIAVAVVQRINLLDRVVLAYLGGVSAAVVAIIVYFSRLPQDQIATISTVAANVILFGVIAAFISLAMVRGVNVYDAFIDGAREGFPVVIQIISYFVAILIALCVFCAAGAMDYINMSP